MASKRPASIHQRDQPSADKLLQQLQIVYAEVDRRIQELVPIHSSRLKCRSGCRECCIDGITVHEIEAVSIRRSYPELCAHGKPHPPGACAFLDERGACRIYSARPYVCRTQGLPLHWVEENDDGTLTAYRDLCPENEPGVPVEQLPQSACWVIGPVEEELAMLQYAWSGRQAIRIELRTLFQRHR